MYSTISFLVVNSLLSYMLYVNYKKKAKVDFLFMLCLLFTFVGNYTISFGFNNINTFISLGNALFSIYLIPNANKIEW